MPEINRISATLSTEDKAAVFAALATLHAKLPFLLSLTPDERVALPKMSDKSVAFDEKVEGYMKSLPQYLPGFVEPEEVDKDRALRADLADLARELEALAASLDDTLMVVGSELWMADLAFYQSLRQAAKRGLPGAETAFADLSERFPGGSRPAKGTTTVKTP